MIKHHRPDTESYKPKRLAYWQPIVKKFHSSSLSIRKFCEQEQLPVHKFRYWLYRVPKLTATSKRSKSIAKETMSFVPVNLTVEHPPAPDEQGMSLQCQWPGVKITVEIDSSNMDVNQLMSTIGGWYAKSRLCL